MFRDGIVSILFAGLLCGCAGTQLSSTLAPDWTKKFGAQWRDGNMTYVVGVGESANLANAREKAQVNAVTQLLERQRPAVHVEAISRVVAGQLHRQGRGWSATEFREFIGKEIVTTVRGTIRGLEHKAAHSEMVEDESGYRRRFYVLVGVPHAQPKGMGHMEGEHESLVQATISHFSDGVILRFSGRALLADVNTIRRDIKLQRDKLESATQRFMGSYLSALPVGKPMPVVKSSGPGPVDLKVTVEVRVNTKAVDAFFAELEAMSGGPVEVMSPSWHFNSPGRWDGRTAYLFEENFDWLKNQFSGGDPHSTWRLCTESGSGTGHNWFPRPWRLAFMAGTKQVRAGKLIVAAFDKLNGSKRLMLWPLVKPSLAFCSSISDQKLEHGSRERSSAPWAIVMHFRRLPDSTLNSLTRLRLTPVANGP